MTTAAKLQLDCLAATQSRVQTIQRTLVIKSPRSKASFAVACIGNCAAGFRSTVKAPYIGCKTGDYAGRYIHACNTPLTPLSGDNLTPRTHSSFAMGIQCVLDTPCSAHNVPPMHTCTHRRVACLTNSRVSRKVYRASQRHSTERGQDTCGDEAQSSVKRALSARFTTHPDVSRTADDEVKIEVTTKLYAISA